MESSIEKMRVGRLLVYCVLFLSFITLSYSSVEVFSEYNTYLKFNSNNSIHIEKNMSLKNVYDTGIVPGQMEFKIGRGTGGSVGEIVVSNVVAKDFFGNEINSRLRETNEYSVVILDIYYPLLPGFEYDFTLEYDISYKSGGIFFKSFEIPLRESTIPIRDGEFKVEIPSNYHFTYTYADGEDAIIENNVATWKIINDNPKSIEFEYSWIPIRIGNLKGSYVFWITLIILIVIFIGYEIRKSIRKYREEHGE
jgi:hypothetical protein